MLSRRTLLQSAAMASVAMPYLARTASAQDAWPSREIHSICGFPPGSGADVFVRFYGKKLEDKLGKTIITENKVGAFGNIATEYVARSKPDGYTLFIAPGSSFLAAAPSLFKKLAFDPVNDFEHVTTLSKLPFILVVAGDSPYKSVADLTAYLKQQGDKGSYASVANTGIVSSELYKANFGLNTVEVKYKDAGAMLNDLWGAQRRVCASRPGHLDGAPEDRQAARSRHVLEGAVQGAAGYSERRRIRHHQLGHHRVVVGAHAEGHAKAGARQARDAVQSDCSR